MLTLYVRNVETGLIHRYGFNGENDAFPDNTDILIDTGLGSSAIRNETIQLTRSMCKAVCQFIEMYFATCLREEVGCDDMEWVCDLLMAHRELKRLIKEEK